MSRRTHPAIEPCLARPAKEPAAGDGWIHEIKHDGLRIMARRDARGRIPRPRSVIRPPGEAGNKLLNPDRGDVQLWHVRGKIGISFVRADDEGTRLGDNKISTGHPGIGSENQWAI
jgi:hypothetical protein